jgi:hypothetical protein
VAVEGVPLYIGGGEAEHSAEMMRMQNYFHFRGQEGWLTSTSGAVQTLATPGAGVSLLPGPFLVNSRFAGGAMQMYMGRILQATEVDTTNVPPGSGRSDLVVMNVEDPYPSDGVDWPYPGSRATGPYISARVIDDVPATTLTLDDLDISRPERGWTGLVAARLDRPGNTGTVTGDMIVPLRSIVNPWAGVELPQAILDNLTDLDTAVSEIGEDVEGLLNQKIPVPAVKFDAGVCTASVSSNTIFPSTFSWTTWPQETNSKLVIPPWATHMRYYVEIIGALCKTSGSVPGIDANVFCSMRANVGFATGLGSVLEFLEPLDVRYSGCCDIRLIRQPFYVDVKTTGRLTLDPRDIGRVVNWKTQVEMLAPVAGCASPFHNGQLQALPGVTEFYFSFEFLEGDSVQ